MPKNVTFSDAEPRYISERDCLEFDAQAEDRPVKCLITAELLMSRFGARDISQEELRQAFDKHKEDIRALARAQIDSGWVDADGQIILTTRITNILVKANDAFAAIPAAAESRAAVVDALRFVVGPAGGQVVITLDLLNYSAEPLTIKVTIEDPALPGSAKEVFTPAPPDDHVELYVDTGIAWSKILRLRYENLHKPG